MLTTGQNSQDFMKLVHSFRKVNNIYMPLLDQYIAIIFLEFIILEKNGIQIMFTCVNHPKSNGLDERLNQTLVNRFRCKINVKLNRSWTTLVRQCVDEYNVTIHSSTHAFSYLY